MNTPNQPQPEDGAGLTQAVFEIQEWFGGSHSDESNAKVAAIIQAYAATPLPKASPGLNKALRKAIERSIEIHADLRGLSASTKAIRFEQEFATILFNHISPLLLTPTTQGGGMGADREALMTKEAADRFWEVWAAPNGINNIHARMRTTFEAALAAGHRAIAARSTGGPKP